MDFNEFEKWMDANGRISSQSDDEEHDRICAMLPGFSPTSERSCGAHSYPSMRLFLREVQPKRLLEIGFNLGHSALFWLKNGVRSVTSIELRNDESVLLAAKVITEQGLLRDLGFPGAFKLISGDSTFVIPTLSCNVYDAAFIDGSHEYGDVMADISGCLQLGIPHLFFDDWLTIYGGVQQAIHDSKLHVLWVSGNQALCTK